MHSDVAVDELRDCHVGGDARQLIRRLFVEPFGRGQEVNHLLNRDFRRLRQVSVGPHADVVGRRLGARPGERHPLSYDELQPAAERRLYGGLIHFAVALCGVPIANFEEGSCRMHRDEERGARDELLVVEVAGVYGRRIAADASG